MPLLGKFINPIDEEHFYPSPLDGFVSIPVFIKLTPATVGLFKSTDCQLVGYRTETGRPNLPPTDTETLLSVDYWLPMNNSNTVFEVNGYLCHTNLLVKREVIKSKQHPYPYFELDFIVEGKETPVVFDVNMEATKGYITKPLYFHIHQRENRLNVNYHASEQKNKIR